MSVFVGAEAGFDCVGAVVEDKCAGGRPVRLPEGVFWWVR